MVLQRKPLPNIARKETAQAVAKWGILAQISAEALRTSRAETDLAMALTGPLRSSKPAGLRNMRHRSSSRGHILPTCH